LRWPTSSTTMRKRSRRSSSIRSPSWAPRTVGLTQNS
jgi:hypothetical protein